MGTHIKREPRVARPDQHLQIFPLAEVRAEVLAGRALRVEAARDRLGVHGVPVVREVRVDVARGLLDIALDVERETRRLWDRQPEVERDDRGHAAEPDDHTPDPVDVLQQQAAVGDQTRLVCAHDDTRSRRGRWRIVSVAFAMRSCDSLRTELAPTLVGEDCGHDPTSYMRR